jgi:hypothetical protein
LCPTYGLIRSGFPDYQEMVADPPTFRKTGSFLTNLHSLSHLLVCRDFDHPSASRAIWAKDLLRRTCLADRISADESGLENCAAQFRLISCGTHGIIYLGV